MKNTEDEEISWVYKGNSYVLFKRTEIICKWWHILFNVKIEK